MPTYPAYFLGACHRNQTYFFIWPNLSLSSNIKPQIYTESITSVKHILKEPF